MFNSERSKMLLVGVAVAALSVGIFASGSANGAASAPAAQYSPAERAAIEAIVRDYILTHPEIIPEAINGMQAREVGKLLDSNRAEIEKPFAGAVAGNPNGDTTLVVFFDYACPYCRASHADVTRADRQRQESARRLPRLPGTRAGVGRSRRRQPRGGPAEPLCRVQQRDVRCCRRGRRTSALSR